MAIATKTKPKTNPTKKRAAEHHRHTKHYVKSYWPYLPMIAIIAGGLFMNVVLSRPASVLGSQINLTGSALLAATNQDRVDNKLGSLTSDTKLQQAAQTKANDMVSQNYWSHVTPSGKQPWAFISASGYQYQAAGENLAYGFTSADAALNAWMHSPSHRANILNSSYSQVGFGIAQSQNFVGKGPETVIVAMYALPADGTTNAPVTTVLTNTSTPVSRLQSVDSAVQGLVVGIIGTLAIVLILIRHTIAWHKLLRRGETFVLKHPMLDASLVLIAVVAVTLQRTVGFIS